MKTLKNLLQIIPFILLLGCSEKDVGPIDTNPGSSTGKGGSMARFTVIGNYLYTVNNASMKLFDISNPGNPSVYSNINLGWGIETLFPYKDHLFIGTETGMMIYDNTNPALPIFVSRYDHIYSCDPVVVDDEYAYVTLSNGSRCQRGVNRLEIIDIKNLKNPFRIAEYSMTNPLGLGIDNKILFVCDDGLKVYDVSDPYKIKLQAHFNIKAYDVIPLDGHLLVIGSDGLYQYTYDAETITLISKINLPI